MNHRNLKILIFSCWVLALAIGLFAFIYYSIPSSDENHDRFDLAKACELDQNFKNQLETNDDLIIGKKAAETPISEADGMAPGEWPKLMEKANIYMDFDKSFSSNEVELEIHQRMVQIYQDERVSKQSKLFFVSTLFVVISFGFALLLFITRDPAKTK